jgi:hypothetical protein
MDGTHITKFGLQISREETTWNIRKRLDNEMELDFSESSCEDLN